MSVPVNQRSQGKLEAYSKAYDLTVYTLKITSNKKIFAEAYKESITEKITSAVLDVYLFVGTANEKQVRTENDYNSFRERMFLQKEAMDRCGYVIKMILLAKPIFHLSSKRVKYWTEKTKETRSLIKAWHDADRKRFEPLFKDKGVG